MKLKLSVILFIFFAVISFSCAQDKSDSDITVAQLKQQMKTDSTLVILDVRTPPELSGPLGQIEGVVNIPVQDLEKRIGELEKYKDKNIDVICRTGHRSRAATDILLKNGYRAKNVLGGMTQYRAEK